MQDFKHLSHNRRSSLFKQPAQNRKLSPPVAASSVLSAPPTGKRRKRLVRILAVLVVLLGLGPLTFLLAGKLSTHIPKLTSLLSGETKQVPPRAAEAARPRLSPFEQACGLLPSAAPADGRLAAVTADGERYEFSIVDSLQQRVHEYFEKNKVPYGVFVALEPASGRILAMTAYSSVDPQWPKSAYFELYPMASLFKIVTASAALEAGKINPDSVVEFRGGSYSENPRHWSAAPRGRNNRMDVTYAMGKSINPVYGRIASDIAGKDLVMERVRSFGFNQALLPGVPVKESKACEPSSELGLRLMGCGLDHEVKVSPLHAALIMASLANGGKMMSPSLTDRVVDGAGSQKEVYISRELRQLVSPSTSAALTRMLSTTVTTGTSRRAFHDRRGRPTLAGIDIAAKTGSINGSDPKGHYSWFAAYAPTRNPRIALATLVINQDKWKIKASQVGQQALDEFFRN